MLRTMPAPGTASCRPLQLIGATLLLISTSACGTIGAGLPSLRDSIDFGARVELRVCLLVDPTVGEAKARSLVSAADRELDVYGIDVVVPWTRPWTRPAFTADGMLEELLQRPLEPPCDRLVAFAGRNLADSLWGLLLPQTLGAVDGPTHTRGMIVGRLATPGQLLMSPSRTTRHEFYHLLGCAHALTKRSCYDQIRRLKEATPAAGGFVPGVTGDRRLIPSRAAVEQRLRGRAAP
jgi:hypothetical protein